MRCSAAGHHTEAACGKRVAALFFALSRTRRARRSPCTAWLLLLLLRAHTQAAMVRILPEEGQGDGARVRAEGGFDPWVQGAPFSRDRRPCSRFERLQEGQLGHRQRAQR